jgi:hypothetical protein
MRFLYKMLIGLILFNSMLMTFSYFFPMSNIESKAHNITGDPTYTSYGNMETGIFKNMYMSALASGGVIFLGSILIGAFTGSFNLWVGIGAVVSIFVGLWNMSWGVIKGLTDSYPVVKDLVFIMSIIIGILAVMSIAEILTAQRGAD